MNPTELWAQPTAIAAAGLQVPPLTLESTQGSIELRVFCAERAVLYTYPATGVPGRDPSMDPAPGWDDIPGAAGCTVQSLGFKQLHEPLAASGVRVAGISTQPLLEQQAFSERNGIPFPLLCDARLALQRAWSLPTFTVGARVFLERTVLYVEHNVLRIAVYPVANPGLSAEAMLRRLSEP